MHRVRRNRFLRKALKAIASTPATIKINVKHCRCTDPTTPRIGSTHRKKNYYTFVPLPFRVIVKCHHKKINGKPSAAAARTQCAPNGARCFCVTHFIPTNTLVNLTNRLVRLDVIGFVFDSHHAVRRALASRPATPGKRLIKRGAPSGSRDEAVNCEKLFKRKFGR